MGETTVDEITAKKLAKSKDVYKNYRNNALTQAAENLPEGQNTKYVKVSTELAFLPDIDINNPEELKDRLIQFFSICAEHDVKPTVAGLGLALNGIDRRRLWEIANNSKSTCVIVNNLPASCTDLIKKAYKILENQWELRVNDGNINPVMGIFLGTNHFGYLNKAEYVVTPNNDNDNAVDVEDIRKRYLPQQDIIESEE